MIAGNRYKVGSYFLDISIDGDTLIGCYYKTDTAKAKGSLNGKFKNNVFEGKYQDPDGTLGMMKLTFNETGFEGKYIEEKNSNKGLSKVWRGRLVKERSFNREDLNHLKQESNSRDSSFTNSNHFNRVIDLYKDLLIDQDKSWFNNFYKTIESNWNGDNEYYEALSTKKLKVKNLIPKGANMHGVDLPLILGDKGKKIAFVGIDPKRDDSYFKNSDIESDFIIGTPYALHCKKMRNGKTKVYWSFLNLLSRNNTVYLTDVYKVYFEGIKMKSMDHFSKLEKDNSPGVWYKFLKQELSIFDPDVIICMGDKSMTLTTGESVTLKNVDVNRSPHKFDLTIEGKSKTVPVIPMPHLSGESRDKPIFDFLEGNGYKKELYSRSETGILYYHLISEFLKNN